MNIYKTKGKAIASFIASLLIIIAVLSLALGSYSFLKAQFAQYLLERSWLNETKVSSSQNVVYSKPWPWADFHPVAKLTFERFNVTHIVLNSDSGQALAFGPGINQFAVEGGDFNTSGIGIISAHNDTHFSILEKLNINDSVILTLKSGESQTFKVNHITIMDTDTEQLVLLNQDNDIDENNSINELFLVTCYPFGGVDNRTTLRYVVHLV
jgi:sortase A